MLSIMSPKNMASAADLAKVIRGNLSFLDTETIDPDRFCEKHEELIIDCLYITRRPTESLVAAAAGLCFSDSQPFECKAFAQRLCSAVSMCREKAKSATSGKKLSRSVFNIIKVLEKVKDTTLGQSLLSKARALQRRRSDEDVQVAQQPVPLTSPGSTSSSVPLTSPGSTWSSVPLTNPSSSSSSSTEVSRLSVFALYGLTAEPMAKSSAVITVEESPVRISQDEAAVAKAVYFYDASQNTFIKAVGDAIEKASMSTGADGFCDAKFTHETIKTDLPNIMIFPVMKKPSTKKKPAAAEMKRPAAAPKGHKRPLEENVQEPEVVDEEGGETEEVEQDPVFELEQDAVLETPVAERRYGVMYYKANNKVGIRRKFDKKNQAFQFGHPNKSKEELEAIGEEVADLMAKGMSEEQGIAWAKEKCLI